MKLLNYLKVVILTTLIGSTLWSCSENDNGKTRYIAVLNRNWSILDTESGKILCKNEFDHAPSISNDGMIVVKGEDNMYQCYEIDDPKNPVSHSKYSQLGTFGDNDVTFAVKEGGGITIVNKKFEVVKKLPSNVTETQAFFEGLAPFCKDGMWGYLDTKGEVAIPAKFEAAGPFFDGRALTVKGEKIVIIDKKGETVKSFTFDKYSPLQPFYHNGFIAMVKKSNDKVVFLDRDGEETFTSDEMEIKKCYQIDDNKTVFYRGHKYGIISTDGEVILPPTFRDLKYASKDRYIACDKRGLYGIVNSKGEVILDFNYGYIYQISTDKGHYLTSNGGSSCILINEKGEELNKDSFNGFRLDNTARFHSEL